MGCPPLRRCAFAPHTRRTPSQPSTGSVMNSNQPSGWAPRSKLARGSAAPGGPTRTLRWPAAPLPTRCWPRSRCSFPGATPGPGTERWQHVHPAHGTRPRQRLPSVCRAIGEFSESSAPGLTAQQRIDAVGATLNAFYRFTRPHTMLGTFISVCSISLLAMGPGDFNARAAVALAQALVPALLMNISIVGLNQLYDVEIDRVNKPYLPLASGDFSMATGTWLVATTGAAALVLGVWSRSWPLMATLVGSLLLGIAYSTDLPLLRWKRYPMVAASCILAVRAVLVQLGFYLHMSGALGGAPTSLPPQLLFTVAYMLLVSVVIALFKDIPDIAGDTEGGIRTLSVRLGAPRIFWLCIWLLELAYAGAMVASVLCTQVLWSRAVLLGAHAAMAASLYASARGVNLGSPRSIYSCYMHVWKLFYCEYLLIPLFR